MKTNVLLAVVLIAMGIAAFTYQGITHTTREKAVDLGPIQITTEKTHALSLLPVVGGIVLVGGVVLLVGSRQRA